MSLHHNTIVLHHHQNHTHITQQKLHTDTGQFGIMDGCRKQEQDVIETPKHRWWSDTNLTSSVRVGYHQKGAWRTAVHCQWDAKVTL